MCKYCKGDKWIYENSSLTIGVNSNILEVHTDVGDYYKEIKINHCPMCGKKLK